MTLALRNAGHWDAANKMATTTAAGADFNVLGIQMRGYHDLGVALQDPKGGCKAKGEA